MKIEPSSEPFEHSAIKDTMKLKSCILSLGRTTINDHWCNVAWCVMLRSRKTRGGWGEKRRCSFLSRNNLAQPFSRSRASYFRLNFFFLKVPTIWSLALVFISPREYKGCFQNSPPWEIVFIISSGYERMKAWQNRVKSFHLESNNDRRIDGSRFWQRKTCRISAYFHRFILSPRFIEEYVTRFRRFLDFWRQAIEFFYRLRFYFLQNKHEKN